MFRSVPFRSVPFRSVPFRSVPFRSVPFRSVPFRSVPFRNARLSLILSLALVLGLAGPGLAAERDLEQIVDAVVPGLLAQSAAVQVITEDDGIPQAEEDSSLYRVGDGVTVEIAENASDGVQLSFDEGDLGISVEIDRGSAGEDLNDGAVAYRGTHRDTDTIAQAVPDGVRFINVIHSERAPAEFAYALDVPDGAALSPDGHGGYEIVDAVGVTLATIPSPWAVDANGESRLAIYRAEGDTLILEVDHVGAAYPVVADPWACYSIFCGWRFSNRTTRAMIDGLLAGGLAGCRKVAGTYGVVACGALASYIRTSPPLRTRCWFVYVTLGPPGGWFVRC